MKATRRDLLGMVLAAPLAGAAVEIGLSGKKEPDLNELNQFLWRKHWEAASERPLFVHPTQMVTVEKVLGMRGTGGW